MTFSNAWMQQWHGKFVTYSSNILLRDIKLNSARSDIRRRSIKWYYPVIMKRIINQNTYTTYIYIYIYIYIYNILQQFQQWNHNEKYKTGKDINIWPLLISYHTLDAMMKYGQNNSRYEKWRYCMTLQFIYL